MNEAVCEFIDRCVFPEWTVILSAIIALVMVIHMARRNHKVGAVIFIAAISGFIATYAWIWMFDPTLIERAIFVRISTIYIMLAIAYYCARETRILDECKAIIKNAIMRITHRGKLD